MSDEKKKQILNPIIIGICGGSASGKTKAGIFIQDFLTKDNCLIFSMDNYFYGPNDEERKDIQNYNFDNPEALDLDLAYKHLKQLKEGKSIKMPLYDFLQSRRKEETKDVHPAKVIIFEGIFSFYKKEIRDLMDIKLFFEIDTDIRLFRRIIRDIEDRGREIKTIVERYLKFVKPSYDKFIQPLKKYADFVIPKSNSINIDKILRPYLEKLIDINNKEINQSNVPDSKDLQLPGQNFFWESKNNLLSVVQEKNNIRKYNKIILNIIQKRKRSYYSIYITSIVKYLLSTNRNLHKEPTKYFDYRQLENNVNIQEYKDFNNIVILIPNLIELENNILDKLVKFMKLFQSKQVKFEILFVFLSDASFQLLSKALSQFDVNYITIYYGDELRKINGMIDSKPSEYYSFCSEKIANEFQSSNNKNEENLFF